MKKFNADGMKILKILHLIFVMLWTVGVVAMILLTLLNTSLENELLMKYRAIRLIDDAIVIPSATITVVIGVLYGLKSNWGFFKHKWITVKWVISIIVILVGTFVLSPVLDANLELSKSVQVLATNQSMLKNENLIFYVGCCSSLSLVFLVVISVLKPWRKKK